jgi:DnaK suppressor protein
MSAKKKAAAKKKVSKATAKKKVAVKKKTATKKRAIAKTKKRTSKKRATKQSPAHTGANGTLEFEPYKEKRGEEYMNERQEAHFRSILSAWRQELMEEVDRTMHHMRDDASNFPDPNDRATQESEFSLELRTRDRERKLIKKISQTIDRLDDHDYGWCDSCGVEVGIRRLEARPTATLCIDCKTIQEQKEKQMA